MFSSAKVADIINEVLRQPDYKVAIDGLEPRIKSNQLNKKIEKSLNENDLTR